MLLDRTSRTHKSNELTGRDYGRIEILTLANHLSAHGTVLTPRARRFVRLSLGDLQCVAGREGVLKLPVQFQIESALLKLVVDGLLHGVLQSLSIPLEVRYVPERTKSTSREGAKRRAVSVSFMAVCKNHEFNWQLNSFVCSRHR